MNRLIKPLIIACALIGLAGGAHADVAPPLSPPESTVANKALVTEMFQKMFVENKAVELADQYFAPDFIEHDPVSSNGIEAFKAFFTDFYKKNPKSVTTVKRIIAEGDLVLVHFHGQSSPEDRGVAGVDIFRVVNGRVVEHWAVIQPIPEKSANDNTMF